MMTGTQSPEATITVEGAEATMAAVSLSGNIYEALEAENPSRTTRERQETTALSATLALYVVNCYSDPASGVEHVARILSKWARGSVQEDAP